MIELGVTPTLVQPVILCGRPGAPLWPLWAEQPLATEPLVVCNEAHSSLVADQLRRAGARPKVVLIEPQRRGTAPALTLAAVHAVTADDPVLLVLRSDRMVERAGESERALLRGAALARQGHLVIFGVPPRGAETGYGYVRAGRPLGRDDAACFVEAFVDRPDAAAAAYCGDRSYLRYAGVVAVRASVWIDAIGNFRREILAACQRAYRGGRRDGEFLRLEPQAFAGCPADSIDYALPELLAQPGLAPEVLVVRTEEEKGSEQVFALPPSPAENLF